MNGVLHPEVIGEHFEGARGPDGRPLVFSTARYAAFHTGPSATGDIEGVLIHGAQGVRSLTVILQD